MSEAEIDIRLLPNANEGSIREAAIQQDFHRIRSGISAEGLPIEVQSYSEKSADGATWLIGEFIVPIMAASSAMWMLIGTWLQAKHGRRMRLKIGDVEAEATSIEEVQSLMKIICADETQRASKVLKSASET